MRQLLQPIAFATVACAGTLGMYGQAVNAGDIRGTATDSSGALVPGVTVTVTNVDTGVVKTLTTNRDGLFDTSSIVIGNYSVKFEKPGFQTLERTGITLQVGFSTVNGVLKVGAATETIEVNSDLPLLTTETGEQSTTFEAKSMAQLPNVAGSTGPDWQNFTILLPGSAGAPQQSNSSTNPGQVVAINGNLPYSNVLADGASTTLSHSQNSDVNTFETVAELQVNTSAFSAQYGIGGVIFNQVSKGGTNQFHGALYDYFQNTALTAFPYEFSNTVGRKPFLRFNNFGGSIGGPVRIPKLFNGRDKLFFYFNYDQVVDHGNTSGTQTLPTELVKAGDFTGQPLIYDPTTQVIAHDSKGNPYPVRQSFLSETGRNAIPTAMFDKVSAAFQSLYPTPTTTMPGTTFQPGTTNSVGVVQNNYYASLQQSNPYRRYFGRLDYNITSKNRLSLSDTQRDQPIVAISQVTACPLQCQNQDVDSNNAQVTDVHTFSSRTINEARFGFTNQGNFYGDQTLGKGYPQQLGFQYAKADNLPNVQYVGSYEYAWINASANAVYKEHLFDPSDVVTMIRGKHILHFGGEFLMYQDNSTAWGNLNGATLQFRGDYTRHWNVNTQTGVASADGSTGLDYADFLLGDARSWSAGTSPEYGGRLKSPQVFIQDDFKVRPNLTVNLGLRYQIRHGWTEVKGNMEAFDPTVINPATGTPGAIWYGETKANGRSQLQAPDYAIVLPRVGFSWLPNPNTTLRGGFGMYAYNLSLDTYGSGMGGSVSSSGNATDQLGITPITTFSGTGANLPFTSASTDPARFNGQGANYNQYHTPDPKIYQYNLAMQNTLGNNMVFELAYVGSHGTNLNYPTDINAVPVALATNANDQASRPFPNYQGLGGSSNNGISNYNSLQASVQRRLSKGVSFDANYTWAHFLDSQDSSGWGSRSGNQNYQIANDPAANYSNSNFDVRNAFKGRAVVDLPFGHGRKFLNKNFLLDTVLGGYQVSSTMIFQSGNPFTVDSSQQNYQQAGTPFPNYSGANLYPAHKTFNMWFNPGAFTLPSDGTYGNVRRNSLYGPGVELVNISAGKSFAIHEAMRFLIRADATNAFNHANFGLPGGGIIGLATATGQVAGQAYAPTASGAQQINGTTNGGRNLQISARFEF